MIGGVYRVACVGREGHKRMVPARGAFPCIELLHTYKGTPEDPISPRIIAFPSLQSQVLDYYIDR